MKEEGDLVTQFISKLMANKTFLLLYNEFDYTALALYA